MKPILKKITIFLLSTAVLIGVILAITKHNGRLCNSIEVEIDYQGGEPILNREDVLNYLKDYNIKIQGERFEAIDMDSLKSVLSKHPYIYKLSVVSNIGSKLFIQLIQVKPIMHVFTENEEQYFIDDSGKFLPFSSKIKDKTVIVNGNIREKFKPEKSLAVDTPKTPLEHVYVMVKHFNTNDFLKAQFEQIYITKDKDIELIPVYGNHLVLLSNSKDIEKKMRELVELYKYELNREGWDKYKILNLKYKNRIIGVKSDKI